MVSADASVSATKVGAGLTAAAASRLQRAHLRQGPYAAGRASASAGRASVIPGTQVPTAPSA